jgi:arabinofuranosyltransferase
MRCGRSSGWHEPDPRALPWYDRPVGRLLASFATPARADAASVLLLLLLLAWYVPTHLDLGGRPEEDAAILLRYSKHLAAGYGIVWNVGEPPVDGATDFLFMLAAAGLHHLGVPLERAAQAIGLAAHAGTVAAVFLGVRRFHDAGAPLALVPAAFLALGPGLRHLAAGYGTPLFALASALGWLAATAAARAGAPALPSRALVFALAALALGLARPEGVFLGGEGARVLISRFLAVFLTLGLAYFLWRWHYFGYPLPNPYYKKGAGGLYWHSLRMSWRNLWALGLPFVALLPLGLLLRETRRAALAATLPVAAFVATWVLLSDETNYVMRFRYPILPVVLMACVPVWQALVRRLGGFGPALTSPPPAAAWALAFAAAVGLAAWQHSRYRHVAPRRMGLYEAALVLRDYSRYHYTLVTTEAGLLPLYSGWRAVDAWGLNDAHIAHTGEVTDVYLDRYRPEVIVFHAYFSPGVAQAGPRIENRALGPRWYRMVMTLKRYAEERGYVLAAVFGRNAWDTHWYFVRPGFPWSDTIVQRLRGLEYYWDGEPTVDLRDES